MSTVIVAVLSFAGFILAYFTYGRWLGRKIFGLDHKKITPSHKLNDGTDFVPTRRSVLFGHHFTSIAGTGPIVGPAIAVFWGWLPALLWVIFGSIFIGAVHDFGALVVSMRHQGRSVGDIAKDIISPRAQLLLLILLATILALVLAVFGLVIALIFSLFPESVLPVWISLPMAVCVGLWVYKRKGGIFIPSLLALAGIYLCVWLGTLLPVDLSQIFNIPLLSGSYANVVVVWTVILFIYCFVASVLPVWVLLQPRDFINANQLFVALGVSFVGVFVAGIFGGADMLASAPAVAKDIPADAPPILPFLFITVACGAVSGFHSLVSSGTSSKQIANEHDAEAVGYGGMLLEGSLAVIVLLACTAGVGMGLWDRNVDSNSHRITYTKTLDADGQTIKDGAAWKHFYNAKITVDPATGKTTGGWANHKLGIKLEAFIEGAANFLNAVGLPIEVAVSMLATLVACFAATTIDTATRLQRYVFQEIGSATKIKPLTNKYVATTFAVITGLSLAVFIGDKPGSGGMALWPMFGASNQILAGLGFLVIMLYLIRRKKPIWFIIIPAVLMLVLPAWAMLWNMFNDNGWLAKGNYLLMTLGCVSIFLTAWLIIEALIAWKKAKEKLLKV